MAVINDEHALRRSISHVLATTALADAYQADDLIIVIVPGAQFVPVPASANFGADSFDRFYTSLKAALDAAK